MKIIDLLKLEFKNFGRYEKIFFPLIIILVIIISIFARDSIIALVSAVCGISYTILAGKGKISCYFIGMTGTLCYSYLSFLNGFFGNLLLYSLYYLPMEILGIFYWKKHLNKKTREIIKTKLSSKERIFYLLSAFILSCIFSFFLKITGGFSPYFDGFTTIFSILGQILTLKRCIEQWYVWGLVNLLSLIMWILAYYENSNCLATVLMWFVYFILSVYFLFIWKKELNSSNLIL